MKAFLSSRQIGAAAISILSTPPAATGAANNTLEVSSLFSPLPLHHTHTLSHIKSSWAKVQASSLLFGMAELSSAGKFEESQVTYAKITPPQIIVTPTLCWPGLCCSLKHSEVQEGGNDHITDHRYLRVPLHPGEPGLCPRREWHCLSHPMSRRRKVTILSHEDSSINEDQSIHSEQRPIILSAIYFCRVLKQ